MEKFLELEGAYLVMGGAVLLITLFVTTRPFASKGAIKRGIGGVTLVLAIAIGLHYKFTTDRMSGVKTAFLNNQTIICESRMNRKGAQSVLIEKNNDWIIEGDIFVSPNYSRPFHTARCLIK